MKKSMITMLLLAAMLLALGAPALADEKDVWLKEHGYNPNVTPTAIYFGDPDTELGELLEKPDANKAGGFTYHLEKAVGEKRAAELKAGMGRGVYGVSSKDLAWTWSPATFTAGTENNPYVLDSFKAIIGKDYQYAAGAAFDFIGRYLKADDTMWKLVSKLTYAGRPVYNNKETWAVTAAKVSDPTVLKTFFIYPND